MLIYKLAGANRLYFSRLHRRVFNLLEIAAAAGIIFAIEFTSGSSVILVIPLIVLLIGLLQSDRGVVALLLSTKPAQFLGQVSYSIYMVHGLIVLSVVIVLNHIMPMVVHRDTLNIWTGDLLVIMTIIGVVGAARATYSYIEEPGRLFGRRRYQ
jgi:peptidoglycan/LPS O-acetylase OafA/YrhL